MSRSIRCLFCGDPTAGKKSDEHVIPQWLSEHLKIKDELFTLSNYRHTGEWLFDKDNVTIYEEPGLDINLLRQHEFASFVSRRVCKDCNTGWMNKLETRVKPVLIPLIDGTRSVTTLDDAEKRLVSKWAAKTVYVSAFTSNNLNYVDETHPRHLNGERGWLKPDVHVFAAQFKVRTKPPVWWKEDRVADQYGIHTGVHPDALRKARRRVRALAERSYKMTLGVGNLFLTVAYWGDPKWVFFPVRGLHTPLSHRSAVYRWGSPRAFPPEMALAPDNRHWGGHFHLSLAVHELPGSIEPGRAARD